MLDLAGIPVFSAILFFVAGLIFGSCFSRKLKANHNPDKALAIRLARSQFAWKTRKKQYLESKYHESTIKELRVELEQKNTEIAAIKRSSDSITSPLHQLEYDYLEQKEQLNRQVRRNRMLNAQLSEVIEAKTKLSALTSVENNEKANFRGFSFNENLRMNTDTSTRPLIISERVKLRIPRKADDSI